MIWLRDSNFDIVIHVHDEVVFEAKKYEVTVKEICDKFIIKIARHLVVPTYLAIFIYFDSQYINIAIQ